MGSPLTDRCPAPLVEAVREVADTVGLRGAYRLLYAALARRWAGPAPAPAPALVTLSLDPAVPHDLREAAAEALVARLVRACPEDPDRHHVVRRVGTLHQDLLSAEGRRAAGAWYTPPALVEHLLDETLEPALDDLDDPLAMRLCDPACGSGLFLVGAARRILARVAPDDRAPALATCLTGNDLDLEALELARTCLWLLLVEPSNADAGGTAGTPVLDLRRGDALTTVTGPFDVVVGNPPFLNRLRRRTAYDAGPARRESRVGGTTSAVSWGAYADVSAMFLDRAVSWVRPGGRVGLVQPLSVLASRDTAPVRFALADACTLESLWIGDADVFDAAVHTCAVVLRRCAGDEAQPPVRRSDGLPPVSRPAVEVGPGRLEGEWGFLVADALGIPSSPSSALATSGTVGDLASCTADFRDQYYGLSDALTEHSPAATWPTHAPLVTSGLVEPAESLWGHTTTRVLKQSWQAPVVDLARLGPSMRAWAETRLVPKILVGTQGRVIEAVADVDGHWLPSVPVITVVPREDRLWQVLAVLLAPPVAAHAAARYAGTALSPRAVKLSARQVAALPLPLHQGPWDEAAFLVERAHTRSPERHEALREAAALMCRAYDVPAQPVLDWWCERAFSPGVRRGSRRRSGPPPAR